MICTQRTEGLWATPNLLHNQIKKKHIPNVEHPEMQ